MKKPTIGIIGGSGLYSMPGFTAHEEMVIETPWGMPSDPYVVGQLAGKEVAFLVQARPRPSPFAVGAEFSREHLRLQVAGRRSHRFVERRRIAEGRTSAAQVCYPGSIFRSHARPCLHVFRRRLGGAHQLRRSGVPAALRGCASSLCSKPASMLARGGTYLCMEGPAFSTKAESNVYRSWGMDVIGMTNLQEAKLAREAELCYVTIAMVTDYDCWHAGARRGDGDRHSGEPEAECRQCLQGSGGHGREHAGCSRSASADRRWRTR